MWGRAGTSSVFAEITPPPELRLPAPPSPEVSNAPPSRLLFALLCQNCSPIFSFPKLKATASFHRPLSKLVKGAPVHTPFYPDGHLIQGGSCTCSQRPHPSPLPGHRQGQQAGTCLQSTRTTGKGVTGSLAPTSPPPSAEEAPSPPTCSLPPSPPVIILGPGDPDPPEGIPGTNANQSPLPGVCEYSPGSGGMEGGRCTSGLLNSWGEP